MKRMLALAALFLAASPALAEMRTAQVEFSYSGDAGNGYRLYLAGVRVCTIASATAQSMECRVNLQAGSNSFTLTAVDAAGVESPPSAPYIVLWTVTSAEQKRVLEIGVRNRRPAGEQSRDRMTPPPKRERVPAPGAGRSRIR